MSRKGLKILWLACIMAGMFFPVAAQQTKIYTAEIAEYRKGLELFDKQKFSAAQRQFNKAIARMDNPSSEVTMNSEYFAALCAVELFHKDAEHLMMQFIRHYPESPRVKTAYFQLGRYNYRKRKWDKVIEWLARVDIYDLNNTELSEYYFKLGYAYFQEDDFENAAKMFYEIKDVDNEYAAPAKYYFAHISYNSGNYETALQDFKALERHEKFAPVVPYYITQIYYMQQKYDDLLAYAPALLDSASPKRAPEISRLIGEAYYGLEKYKDAVPYLENYSKGAYGVSREDSYQLGYACYRGGMYDRSIEILKRVVNENDLIAQTAYYHIADAYLKLDQKKQAIHAFKAASEMTFDEKIQEESMFNYAKLSYEISYDPYFQAVNAFWDYVDKYPESEKRDEALSYLVNLYMTSKNYKAAMVSLEAVKNPDHRLKTAFQKIAFNLGVEHLLNGFYQASINNFKKVRIHPVDPVLNTMSYYWTGDAYYRIGNYSMAILNYKTFLFEPRAILQPEFPAAHYNIAYAYFKMEDYPSAIMWFRKYVQNKDAVDTIKINDAYLRIADAYFVSKDYNNAVDFYGHAAGIKKMDTDYALFQKAMALGILKRAEEKIATLEQLLQEFEISIYAVDAKYELGKAYLKQGDNDKALASFTQVINEFPNSSYVKKALLNTGLLYYNAKENEKALAVFQQIVKDYPNYEDSREALSAIRNIYVDLGEVENYEEYISKLDFVDISQASLDSTNYEAAYLQYVQGKCENAEKSFSRYLEKFQPGIYALNAQFYRAECYLKAGRSDEALKGFDYVISQPLNKFTESALTKASDINFRKNSYAEALTQYMMLENVAEYKSNILESRIGQMRCFYNLGNFQPAIEYARKVIKSDKVEENVKLEAHLIIGNAAMELNDQELAVEEYKTVFTTTKSIMGAEARYNFALIQFRQEKLDEAEQSVFELVNAVPAYEFWIAKGLILLADIYSARGDNFQAKATLNSIIDNYQGEELKKAAKEKLDAIIEKEKQKEEEIKRPEELEIDFGNGQDNPVKDSAATVPPVKNEGLEKDGNSGTEENTGSPENGQENEDE